MPRYHIGPPAQSDDWIEPCDLPKMDIEVSQPRPIGLVDHLGRTIWTGPDPIGFRFADNLTGED